MGEYNFVLSSIPQMDWNTLPDGAEIKDTPVNVGHTGSIPGSERSSGVGNGNPFWYSCLENSMDRGAWRATVHGVAKRQTSLKAHTHTHTHLHIK